MILNHGNMWSVFDQSDLFLVTTNSMVKNDGTLVMGRGIALVTKKRFPDVPRQAGNYISQKKLDLDFYGIIHGVFPNAPNLGLFQTKRHWKEHASIKLVRQSLKMLNALSRSDEFKDKRIDLNFPGIGNGQIPFYMMLPEVEQYLGKCDNINVWLFR